MAGGLVAGWTWLGPEAVLDATAPDAMTLRFFVGGIILLYAIWTDVLERRVSNRLWIVTLVVAVFLGAYDLLDADPPLLYWAIAPGLMAVYYLLWRTRLLFGGADAKAVMAFALLIPYPPALAGPDAVWPHLPAFLPFSLTMLMDAVVFTLGIPLAYLVFNLASGRFHPVAMFLGTRLPIERVLERPVWVMDWVEIPADREPRGDAEDDEEAPVDDLGLPIVDHATLEGASIRLRYLPSRGQDHARNLARLRALGVPEVWATPKIPFMVPLFLGFLTAFLVGDLILAATLWASGRL